MESKFNKLYNLIMQDVLKYKVSEDSMNRIKHLMGKIWNGEATDRIINSLGDKIYTNIFRSKYGGEDTEWLKDKQKLKQYNQKVFQYIKNNIEVNYNSETKKQEKKDRGDQWSQFTFIGNRKEKEKAFNFYFTIDLKDEENFKRYYTSLEDLKNSVIKFGHEHGNPSLAFKMLNNLDSLWGTGYTGENDHIKFYYYDQDLKNDFKKLIVNWLEKHKISTLERPYSQGEDDDTGERASFGQIAGKKTAKYIVKLIEKEKKENPSLTFDQFFNKFKNNLTQIIKTVTNSLQSID